jgi:RHS repeat-associated protein
MMRSTSCASTVCFPPYLYTGKEHDAETNLENFGARYDASSMGRFMSPDPIGGRRTDPQTLNKYPYVRNNPLTFTDPTGLYTCVDSNDCGSKADRAFYSALIQLRISGFQGAVDAAAYGGKGEDNGVTVGFKSAADMGPGIKGSVLPTGDRLSDGKIGNLRVQVDFLKTLKGKDLEQGVAHEGSHVHDALNFFQSYDFSTNKFNGALNYTHYDTEFKAFEAGATVKPYRNLDCGNGNSCDIVAGPRGYSNLDKYLNSTPDYRDANQLLQFNPTVWPQ